MTSTHEVKYDIKSYTMFERPKTSHGRRASTGNSMYHEAKPVRREYQYPDRIEHVPWEGTGGEQDGEGRFHDTDPGGSDQGMEFHQHSRNHRRESGGQQVEGFDRPDSRRGYPRPGRPFVDCGLDSPRCASFDDESYVPSSHPATAEEPKRKLRPKSARRHSTHGPHGPHRTQVFDVPITRPPSSLTRFQPLPSIGSKPDNTAGGEMDRLVLHADKLQLHDGEDHMGNSVSQHPTRHEPRSVHHDHKHRSKQHQEPHEPEHKSHLKHGFEYKEDDSDLKYSGLSENHGFHQEIDGEGFLRKSDVRQERKWLKHSERSHASPDRSPRAEDRGLFRPSQIGGRTRKVSLSPEPSDNESRLLLAVKLPSDGQRFQRYFRPSSSLREVIVFAESAGEVDLSAYSIACNAPRRVFTDFDQTCQEVGLQDRTLLYFERRNI
ncbi:uncharacterized protein LOC121390551 [Gigantopelta aegis]|uniref:uncharacterized protein LOC121390551 n=1 Tax=Gigantopelta aegis TaxID=1735272 RepID=UPI001B88A261|nr:uncharacterized protein LOC121390551 [Gigantopelta aegis]